MKLFSCTACQQTVYFENSQCTKCGRQLAYLPDRATMTAFESAAGGLEEPFVPLGPPAGQARYRHCGNRIDHGACNWAVPERESQQRFCRACRLNQVIPNLADPQAKQAWIK